MAAAVPSTTNQSEFLIDDLMDLEIEKLPAIPEQSRAKESEQPAKDVSRTSSVAFFQKENKFELIQSSPRLRNFVPVKILCDQLDGTHVRHGCTFTAKVLLKPIAGLYGNFVGSEGGKK